MKILVFSDSHGNLSHMEAAVARTHPDRILHLGDGWRDAQALYAEFPDTPLDQVAGNCDIWPGGPTEKVLDIGGVRLLLCHGHTYGVKRTLLSGLYAARERGADLFLFGHTHRPFCETRQGVTLLNPGSIGDGARPSYAVLRLENGGFEAELLRL